MSKRVLLIEDEEGIANAFKKQLELIAGFEVIWIDKCKDALELLKKERFDAILLDLVMPEYDGVVFLKEYHDKAKGYIQSPVIVLTNVTSEETRKEVGKLGISRYVAKTEVVPDDLIAIIEEVSNLSASQ